MKKLFLTLPLLLVCLVVGCNNNSKPPIPGNVTIKKPAVAKAMRDTLNHDIAMLKADNVPSQLFNFDNAKAQEFKGIWGTKISIPENTFEDEQGNIAKGDVVLEIKEIYTAAQMLLGNFTTMAGDKVLQTGGMLYLDATTLDDIKLRIRKGKKIAFSMPIEKDMQDMKLFNGVKNDTTGCVNWVINETPITKTPAKQTAKKGSPENVMIDALAGEEEKFNLIKPEKIKNDDIIIEVLFDKSLKYPEIAQFENVEFKILDKDLYDPEDINRIWHHARLEKTDVYGVYIVNLRGKEITRNYRVMPVFKGKDYEVALAKYNKEFEEYIARKMQEREDAKKALAEANKKFEKTDYVRYYTFTTDKLGYINCDRFMSKENAVATEFSIIADTTAVYTKMRINVLLKDFNSCLPLSDYLNPDNTSRQIELPRNATAWILTTAYKGDVPYYSLSKTSLKQHNNVTLQMTATSVKELKEILEKSI